jgi:type IV secretion system protein TrbL
MNDLNVIDQFLETFITYIDSGFGLLGGDVRFLCATLIGIDMTLAGLFWAMGGEQDIIGRFLRKILYVGAFAFIINSFSSLSQILFQSFAAAGLRAGGGGVGADELLRPGRLAATGFEAAWPLLDQASSLMGFAGFFDNFLVIAILLFAWAIIIIAFFILAVQMFVTLIEFKLVALAGFILIPFALWNRTSFLAERVLGHVVSSGIKVMTLGVIVGIGSGLFGDMVGALGGQEPDIAAAMSMVLAALALFGLGIFAPSVASGLAAGAPQLGAGAALGSVAGAGGLALMGGAAAMGGARMAGAGAIGAIRAGTSMGAATGTAYQLGQETAGSATLKAGLGGVAAAAGARLGRMGRDALDFEEAVARGQDAAWSAMGPAMTAGAARGGAGSAVARADRAGQMSGQDSGTVPSWAQAMQHRQDVRHHRHLAAQTLKDGDRGGASLTPDIAEKED